MARIEDEVVEKVECELNKLCDIPYEEVCIGMRVISITGNKGTVIGKTKYSGSQFGVRFSYVLKMGVA